MYFIAENIPSGSIVLTSALLNALYKRTGYVTFYRSKLIQKWAAILFAIHLVTYLIVLFPSLVLLPLWFFLVGRRLSRSVAYPQKQDVLEKSVKGYSQL